MFRHILVPLDGSLRAESAIAVAARIARASNGMLILLRAVSAAPEYGQEGSAGSALFQAGLQAEQEEAQQYLTGVASSRQLDGLALSVVVPHGPIIVAIQAAVQSYQVDLIVCCGQPASPGEQRPLGLFADRLTRTLDIPVLLLPEQELRYNTLTETGASAGGLVAFTGPQPELALIQPATALLSALAGREPGELHFVALHSSHLQRTIRHPDRQPAAAVHGQRRLAGHGAALLTKARTQEQQEEENGWGKQCVVILGTPLLAADNDIVQGMAAYPRLLVPLGEHLSQA